MKPLALAIALTLFAAAAAPPTLAHAAPPAAAARDAHSPDHLPRVAAGHPGRHHAVAGRPPGVLPQLPGVPRARRRAVPRDAEAIAKLAAASASETWATASTSVFTPSCSIDMPNCI